MSTTKTTRIAGTDESVADFGGREDADAVTPPDTRSGGVEPVTLLFFVIGCAVLVVAAVSVTHLTGWMNSWGTLPVFLVFFLVMSLGGRWFWTGADAIIAAIRGHRK